MKNKMTAMITDEETANARLLKGWIQEHYPSIEVLEVAKHAGQACQLIGATKPNLVFWDNNFPPIGVSAATAGTPAHDNSSPNLNTPESSYTPASRVTIKKIVLPVQDGYLFVHPDEVIRCEASGSYTIFYMKDKTKVVVSQHLKICESGLPAHFFRVHHSHIVNLNHITRYFRGRRGQLLLSDGSRVEVAASRKDAFLGIIHQTS